MSQGPRAADYVHGHHDSVLRSHRTRTAEDSAGYLLAHLRPGQRLLDVGCGPATITAGLAERVSPGRVTAIDTSAEVVAQARAFLGERGVTDVEVLVADLFAHPGTGEFDVVHAHQVLQHVGDPVAALARMRQLCRPGGLVAARDADYAAMTWYPRLPGMDQWLELYRTLARRAGGEPDAGRRLLSWARAAGFTDVTATASTWCYATPELVGWWGGLWADRILDSAIARQALDSGAASRSELAGISAAWREWSHSADAWFAVLHGEIVCRA